MDGQFDHNDFEHFLKQNADTHRLYPSERVWTRIHTRLHGRRRIIALLVLLPLLTASGWLVVEQLGRGKAEGARLSTPESLEQNVAVAPAQHTISNSGPTASKKSISATAVQRKSIPALGMYKTSMPALQGPVSIASVTSNPVTNTIEKNVVISPVEAPDAATIAAELNPTAATGTEATLVNPANTTDPSIKLDTKETQTDIEERYPLDIESVVNSYQRQLHQPRFRWQLHFTPTISYRSLKEDQKFIAQARMNTTSAAMANSTDLASVIRHRPDIGMQLGVLGTYPISKKVDWVTGLQFNVSKYDIAAYNYPSEVATIALMNSWGGASTVSTLTSFRSSGFRSTASWLRNYYYSVSLPIGLQWRVLGKKQTHWGISATVQPTYVVGNRSYVISVDYQNYAEVPYLINKWNLNVGFETYARFQLGKTDFQLGPQLRYQALSSFKKGYPVQEHLYDFGIKLGVRLGK